MPLLFASLALAATALAWGDALAPWATNTDPTDTPRSHVEEVSSTEHPYSIHHGGTMDGTNCRPPIGYAAWHQTWESNRSVRLENVGETDVANPWLSNGRNSFRTLAELVAGALEPGMTDEEKAISVWRWQMNHRFHAYTADNEVNDPVKVFNVYGYTLCGNDAICLSGMWRDAGLQVRPARPVGHVVTEVFYGDRWHLLDGDEHCIFLLRDNRTIADEQEIVRDHDLIKRTHTYGILSRDSRDTDEFSASLYVYDGEPGGTRDCARGHEMSMTLRPGEAITWRWGHLEPVKYHGYEDIADWGPNAVDKVCNGLWEYSPDLAGDLWRGGSVVAEKVVAGPDGLRPADDGEGRVVWRMAAPYVFIGGSLQAEGEGVGFALSWDGEAFEPVEADLDRLFPPAGPARYGYYLECRLPPGSVLRSLRIANDIQMAPLALPGMVVGDNRFTYTDESPEGRRVRITHDWVERSASQPPSAPPAPTYPVAESEVEGSRITFRWEAPEDPGGEAVADYHFELSERPDMKWPLSPSFEKLISLTADQGQARYCLPYTGLLEPDRYYYWRVRAQSAGGVWGPWSETWRFVLRGPAVPVNLALTAQPKRGAMVLEWEPSPGGRRPVRYRVYGSDEKGFSISDEPYKVNVGNQKEKLPLPFPANFICETESSRLAVIGPDLELPNANRAYYRVVAVDEQGNPSGPSDYVAAPRPHVYTRPVTEAKVGRPYSYAVGVTRSLGDLRCRPTKESSYNSSFWDVEHPVFSLPVGPGWLRIDAATGVLFGTPPTAGDVEVQVRAETAGGRAATQGFAIKVAP
jgi:hypothetical protein